MLPNSPLRKAQIVTAFFITFFSYFSFSQNGVQVLDDMGIQKIISVNLKKGLPEYSGIGEQYTFTVDQVKDATNDQAGFIADMKTITSVTDCMIDLANMKVMVKFQKNDPTTSLDNDSHVAEVKAMLDRHHMRLVKSTKIVYYQN